MASPLHFIEPTTTYWQAILSDHEVSQKVPPWKYGCPVELPDSRYLLLPIRQLPANAKHGIASFLANAASFEIVDTLSTMLAARLAPYKPDIIVGLPTLGHALCPGVAKGLGHTRYVPVGYSKKFWYDVALSTPVSSTTSPELGQKRLWIDPHQLSLLKGVRVAVVDDAVSSGTTMLAVFELLETLGINVVVCGVAMKQGNRWREVLGKDRAGKLLGVFDSPLLEAVEDGWTYRT